MVFKRAKAWYWHILLIFLLVEFPLGSERALTAIDYTTFSLACIALIEFCKHYTAPKHAHYFLGIIITCRLVLGGFGVLKAFAKIPCNEVPLLFFFICPSKNFFYLHALFPIDFCMVVGGGGGRGLLPTTFVLYHFENLSDCCTCELLQIGN